MSMLSNVTRGKIKRPVFALIYGPDGVGKTTWATSAPKSIYMGAEDGAANIDTARFPQMRTLSDCKAAITELLNEKHDYQSLVVDSADWMERQIIWPTVCEMDGSSNIDKAQGGYGKGYTEANKIWDNFIQALLVLREKRKMNIIVCAHAQVKTFNDPFTNLAYDRYLLKLNEKAGAIWREAVDAVLFANYQVFAKKENKGDRVAKAYGDGARVLFTERRPAFDAKNRYGLPFELPLSWEAFSNAVDSGTPDSAKNILNELNIIVSELKDEEMKNRISTAIKNAGENTDVLLNILNHARVVANV